MTKRVSFQTQLIIGTFVLTLSPVLIYSFLTVINISVLIPLLAGSFLGALSCILGINREFERQMSLANEVIHASCGKKIEYNKLSREFKKFIDVINQTTDRAAEELDLVRGILNNLPIGILATDRQHNIAFINNKASEMFGYEPKEMLGIGYRELRNLTKAEPCDRTGSPMEQWAAGKQVTDYQMKIVRKDGSSLNMEVNVYPFSDTRGNNLGSVSVMRDLSLEMEYNLLQSWSESILECMYSTLFAVDKEMRIMIFNPAAEKLLEVNAKDVLGKKFIDCLPSPIDSPPVISEAVLDGKQVNNYPITLVVNGKHKHCLLNTAVIRDNHDEVVGAAAVLQDITELRQFEEKVNEQEKLAVVGQMAAGMAHELRNPLTTVRGFIQLIHAKMLQNDQTREYFELIMQEIDRTNEIIRDFLLLAKPKPPCLSLHPVNLLLEELLPLVEGQCLLQNIKVCKQFASWLPPAVLDADQIKQILLNLMQNAMQAMEGCENRVLNLTTGFDKDKKLVVISVTDTGQGIAPENISKLGTPFFSTKDHGTGLGLSVSYRIMEAHRGNVEVESHLGKGTTFRLYLPAGYL